MGTLECEWSGDVDGEVFWVLGVINEDGKKDCVGLLIGDLPCVEETTVDILKVDVAEI